MDQDDPSYRLLTHLLFPICKLLLESIGHNLHAYTNSQLIDIVRFLTMIDKMDGSRKSYLWPYPPLPLHDVIVSEPHVSTLLQKKLIEQLRMDLTKKEKQQQLKTGKKNKYEVVSGYEGVRKGVLSVDITILKNGKIKGFIEVDGEGKYRREKATKQRKLKRSEQLKEALYVKDYPEVPFIRVNDNAVSQKEDLLNLSTECLSAILSKPK
jgi:hypothetical protein